MDATWLLPITLARCSITVSICILRAKGLLTRFTFATVALASAGVAAYRRANPGSKLKTAVTGKVKPGSKAAKRRKSFCARSAGQMKKFPKAAKDPNSRLRQARRRWKC